LLAILFNVRILSKRINLNHHFLLALAKTPTFVATILTAYCTMLRLRLANRLAIRKTSRRKASQSSFPANVVFLEDRQLLAAAPVVTHNASFTVAAGQSITITSTILLVTDADTPADQLIFSLTSQPTNGLLQKQEAGNWSTIAVGGTFTQQQINDSRVRYIHNGGPATADGFSFTVTDGFVTPPGTERVSVGSASLQGTDHSYSPSVSADGQYVAFQSYSENLSSFDANGLPDIFIYDRLADATSIVSVGLGLTGANGFSFSPSISADGRFVTFWSAASNLVANDTNGVEDIFVYDRQTDITTRVSTSSTGEQGNRRSSFPSISADGRFVAFESYASNLVPGDNNGFPGLIDGIPDIFVHDRQSGQTTRVSISSGGAQSNGESSSASISADGRYVAFTSFASNLVTGDTNDVEDIFVFDRQLGQLSRVSVNSSQVQGEDSSFSPSISGNGRYVAFRSQSANLVPGDTNNQTDIFVRDQQTGVTTRVSESNAGIQSNGESSSPSISADGRFVAFWSFATNLVSGDANGHPDVFVRDRQTGGTTRVSVNSANNAANGFSFEPSISADGRFVAYESEASNLVANDTNAKSDIFLRDRGAPPIAIPGAVAGYILQPPEISVEEGGIDVPDNTAVIGWGQVIHRTAVRTRTFTIRNSSPNSNLLLQPAAVTVNSGFTIVNNFTTGQIVEPGGVATLTIALASETIGLKSATLSFANNDSNENPFNFALTANVIAPPVVTIIDDGDEGFSTAGTWSTATSGFGNDRRLASAGAGTAVSSWAFTNLLAGEYRISATWNSPSSNRANDALFTARGTVGGAPLLTTTVNQRIAPVGIGEGGATWQNLGNVTITGSSLFVSLTNTLSGLVTADAIRIERLSTAAVQSPRGNIIDDGDTGFSVTGTWSTVAAGYGDDRRLAATGAGTSTATWSYANLVPGRYQVSATWSVPAANRASNAAYTVRSNANGPALLSTAVNQRHNPASFLEGGTLWQDLGEVTVMGNSLIVRLANSTTGLVTADAVRIERIGEAVAIVDNDDAGFSSTGEWATYSGLYGNDRRLANASDGATTATYNFSGLAAGTYRISASWNAGSNRANDIPYAIRQTAGGPVLTTLFGNQQLPPNGVIDGGARFQDLGNVTINEGSLLITLSSTLSGNLVADAIRIERVG
jgi:Tol biopolymer transport system component